jgi:hypothetical protein
MSNFLNNLVARTLNLAPVVQPRITSRFEPLTAPDRSVEVEAPPTEPHVVTKIVEPRVAEPAPVVITPQVEPRVDFQQVINTIRNSYFDKHEVVQLPVVEKMHERVHTETRINTEKSTDSRLEIRENRILEPARGIEQKNPFNPRLNTPEPAAPVVKEVPVTTPQPIVPRVVTRIEPAPVAPAPRFEIPPPPQVEPTETINVTIGRVDVRAVFSSHAPKAPARTSNVNSLDDYLKQRSEGRR